MKKISFTFLGLLVNLVAMAQSNIRLSNFWADTYFINPAGIDATMPTWKFGLGHRNQWAYFPGAPKTYMLITTYFDKDMSSLFGVRVIADKIGYTTTLDATLTYAYSVNLPNAILNLGLGFRCQQLSYDWAQAIPETDIADPALYGLQPHAKYNTDFGAEITLPKDGWGRWNVGISCINLISLFKVDQAPFTNTNFLYGRFRTNNSLYYFDRKKNWWDFSVSAAIIHTNAYDSPHIFQKEFNANMHINFESSILTVGLLYRTMTEAGIVFGMEWQQFNVSCVYEYPLEYAKEGVIHPIGTIEAIVVYKLNASLKNKPNPFKIDTKCKKCPESRR